MAVLLSLPQNGSNMTSTASTSHKISTEVSAEVHHPLWFRNNSLPPTLPVIYPEFSHITKAS